MLSEQFGLILVQFRGDQNQRPRHGHIEDTPAVKQPNVLAHVRPSRLLDILRYGIEWHQHLQRVYCEPATVGNQHLANQPDNQLLGSVDRKNAACQRHRHVHSGEQFVENTCHRSQQPQTETASKPTAQRLLEHMDCVKTDAQRNIG